VAEREDIPLPCNTKGLDRQTDTSPRVEAKEFSGATANLPTTITPSFKPDSPSISLRPVLALLYERLNAARNVADIDNVVRALWGTYSNGEINDDEAMFLQAAADNRRPLGRRHSSAPAAELHSRVKLFRCKSSRIITPHWLSGVRRHGPLGAHHRWFSTDPRGVKRIFTSINERPAPHAQNFFLLRPF